MFSPDRVFKDRKRNAKMFSYAGANLYRVFGEDWYQTWKKMMAGQLMQMGMNTLGNWSDQCYKVHFTLFHKKRQGFFRLARCKVILILYIIFFPTYTTTNGSCWTSLLTASAANAL